MSFLYDYFTVEELIGVCEIRINLGKEIIFVTRGERRISERVADEGLISSILGVVTRGSVYSVGEKLSNGYLDYKGGIRLGVGGDYVIKNGVPQVNNIRSLVIRLPQEVKGCSKILSDSELYKSILVIGEPFGGKTTLLRDIARRLSCYRSVVVIDERGELSGGVGVFDLGYSEVIRGSLKAKAYIGVVRAMSPDVVITDELFGTEEYSACQDLNRCGIKVITSIHGSSMKSVPDSLKWFDIYIILSKHPKAGSIKDIVYA